jgi:hypothetical protein
VANGTTPTNGTEYALWNASPARKVRGALWGGKKRFGSNSAQTFAAGAQHNLLRLNVGDVVLGGRVFWSALGSSVQFWLGDAGTCDRYKTTTNGAVASINHLDAAAGGDCTLFNNPAGIGFEVTSTTQDVILTFSYAAAPGAITAAAVKVVIELGAE